MPPLKTGARKDDHIHINLEEDVSFNRTTTGLERYRFVHQALPEMDLDDVDTTTTFLGHRLAFPVMIGSMTGGTPRAGEINRILAESAATAGIGMGLGSTRAMLEDHDAAWTFQMRRYAPDIVLFANLGAVQLNYGYGIDACRTIVEQTEADGLFLHLNPLQEALQPEGDTNFSSLVSRIESVCKALTVPVIVKEVGWGMSSKVTRWLLDAGVAAIDVAGAGGTSWSQVEMHRSESRVQREVAASFRDWGIPTSEAILEARSISADVPLIASGGLRTGIDVAKCLALGADVATLAGVILRAADKGPERIAEQIEILHRQLKVAMFVSGATTVAELHDVEMTLNH
jgi:isopentenyl-diphosphate delta-isomerase